MDEQRHAPTGWKVRTNSRVVHLAAWTGAWLVTMALAAFGPELFWSARWLTLLAVLVNLSCGLGWIRANIRYVKVLDEMMQKVQLEAMGISLGVGVVGGLSYTLMDTTNLISFDAEIAYLIVLIGITYIITAVVSVRRYQ